jgi:cysteine desulfurase
LREGCATEIQSHFPLIANLDTEGSAVTLNTMDTVYLDYNATSPIAAEVLEAMLPYLKGHFGNPSSSHAYGTAAKTAVEAARAEVAALLGCDAGEIVFTSGGTESNNFALRGVAGLYRKQHPAGGHLVTSAVEHPAVMEVCRYLEGNGFDLTVLPVDRHGVVDPDDLKGFLRKDTFLVSVMHANNEVGTIQPVAELAALAEEAGALFHTDAAQSVGKIPVDVTALGVDLLTVAGHKLYAPKGVGALYIRSGIVPEKLLYGADHEQNLRAGTENVAQIVALGTACRIAREGLEDFAERYRQSRDLLEELVTTAVPQARVNGDPARRLPNTLSISFPGVQAQTLVGRLSGVAVSAGAACHAEHIDVSAVLQAMNVPLEFAMGTIRLSTGRETTDEDIRRGAEEIVSVVRRLLPAEAEGQVDGPGGTIDSETVRLTRFTHGLGCACKMAPDRLEALLHSGVLTGPGQLDDAAVYRLDDRHVLVQSVDFFTPVVDNPRDFGAVAAANALSDIYAMGGTPLFALNIAAFPDDTLPGWVLQEILAGAGEVAAEAGVQILGGHTISDPEPKFGMVVTGTVHPGRAWLKSGLRRGDALILTKPLGTGIITTGIKRDLVSPSATEEVVTLMRTLNATAAEVLKGFDLHGCTDVTGFGLLGHLREMALASECTAEISVPEVPVLPEARRLVGADVVPGGTRRNLRFLEGYTDFGAVSMRDRLILCDAQTSGGLLAAVPADEATEAVEALRRRGVTDAAVIGTVGEAVATPEGGPSGVVLFLSTGSSRP